MADDNLTRVIRVQIDASQAYGVTEKMAKNVEQMNGSIKRMQEGFGTIAKAWGIFKASTLGWEGLKGVVKASDDLKQLEATFKVLMPASENAGAMLKDLIGISTSLGINMEDTGKVAQRFAVALGSLGATNAQVAQLTENVLMLGRIGGASMADTAEGARQLGQAFASGKLQGDELRSIMERIPLVGAEIAKTMKVATGELYKLGATGKITTDILFRSLLANTDEIRKKFEQLPFTFEQSINRLQTQWTVLLASFNNVSGIGTTLTTTFVYIGSLISYINGQLSTASTESNGWKIIVEGIGKAFKGIIIVVSAIATGIAQLLTSATALASAFGKVATGDFAGAWEAVTKGSKDALAQGEAWKTFANDIVFGTQSIGKSAKESRDYMADYEATLKKLQKGLKGAGSDAKKAASEMEKFKKSIKDMFTDAALIPEKLLLIKAAMDSVNLSTETGVKLYEDLKKMREQLKPPSAKDMAFDEIDKSIDKLRDDQEVMFALQEKIMELTEVGAEGTDEWIAYGEAYEAVREKLDKTGSFKAVQDIKDAMEAGKNLQIQFDAINAAVDRGDIPAAWAENWKNAALGVSKTMEKTKKDTESMVAQFAKLSKKFTEDFADKLVDSLGEASFAVDDFANDFLKAIAKIMVNQAFQNFLKAMANLGMQQGGWIGEISKAFLGSAKGNAWNASGVEFMAQGGILRGPTMFNNMNRLAIAGEAGPEAVVPLQRTAGGDLGVAASPVNIVINNTVSDTVQVTAASNDNADGTKQITVFVEQKVRSMFSSGQMDRTMSSSYGLTRQAR